MTSWGSSFLSFTKKGSLLEINCWKLVWILKQDAAKNHCRSWRKICFSMFSRVRRSPYFIFTSFKQVLSKEYVPGCASLSFPPLISSLSAFFYRPSSLILGHPFIHGHLSLTEYRLTASLSSCLSMFYMLLYLTLCATAAAHNQPSSSRQREREKHNDCASETDEEQQRAQGCLK